MLARIFAPAQLGFSSQIISIECDISNGLPGFVVVGLGDKAVDEAKERVRAALRHAGLPVPAKRITMNLAPADISKDGTGFDLGMAVALLAATGHVFIDTTQMMFAGELGLDGSVRPIRAVLSHAEAAKENGLRELFIPAANAAEAALCSDLTIYAITTIQELYAHLVGRRILEPYKPKRRPRAKRTKALIDFGIIQGQTRAKRALEIAAAGGHNVLMSGPPGAGKTMLARALAGILPPMSFEELVEVNQVHSVAGLTTSGLITSRPFRNPHHTASAISLIGGGSIPRPGEISLSHHGVLFLDELPEFPRSAIEVLRQPMEDGQVAISRASGTVVYPSQFMLIATQNPCPCGFATDPNHDCSCTGQQIKRYTRKISAVTSRDLTTAPSGERSSAIIKRVVQARRKQAGRGSISNGQMTNEQIHKWCKLSPQATVMANQAVSNLSLSARGYMRLLRIARTIADLDNQPNIESIHLSEALQYRARV